MDPSRAKHVEAKASFKQVVSEHGAAVFRFCLTLTDSVQEAEDCFQDTFLNAMRGYEKFRGESQVKTWLFAIAKRSMLRAHRRRVGQPTHLESLDAVSENMMVLGERAGWGASPETSLLQNENRQVFEDSLHKLSKGDREIIVLRDIEALDGESVASLLGISNNAVRTRLHRARLRYLALLRNSDV